jgi:hypothetical protein
VYAYFRADEQIFLRYAEAARQRTGQGGGSRVDLASRPIRMAISSDDVHLQQWMPNSAAIETAWQEVLAS